MKFRQVPPFLLLCATSLFLHRPSFAQHAAKSGKATELAPESAASSTAITPPIALGELALDYPRGAHGESVVTLGLLINAHGQVIGVEALDGVQPFTESAVAAAGSWRFAAARRGGQPIAARIKIEVKFRPPQIESLKASELPDAIAEGATLVEEESAPPQALPSEAEEKETSGTAAFEVLIEGERTIDVKRLGRAEIRQMPGAFGDPFRAIEVLPGVTPIASGLPYFFVRGSAPGNVGYFFDQVSVPLLYHVAAGPGVIHPAFIRSVDLYSGAYPAQYGRYSGGIVAGEPARPEWELRGEASIRIVDAGAFLEVPFAEGRGSAMFGGRYSYTGLVISTLAPEVDLGYWDYQTRISYDLTPRDSVSLFAFGSHDYLATTNDEGKTTPILNLTFHRLNARYDHALSATSGFAVRPMLGVEETRAGGDEEGDGSGALQTRSAGLRVDYHNQLTKGWLFRAGADANIARYATVLVEGDNDNDNRDGGRRDGRPGDEILDYDLPGRTLPAVGFAYPLDIIGSEFEGDSDDDDNRAPLDSHDDLTGGFWLESVVTIDKRTTVIPGLRFDAYSSNSHVSFAVEPRLAARFKINPTVSLVHNVGIAHQPPSFPIPLPGFSYASDGSLQQAFQTSAGIETKLPANLKASVTLFQNVILDTTDLFGVANLSSTQDEDEPFFQRPTNHSYGLEFYIRRSLSARLGGFLSYTLSRSMRSIPGAKGPSSFDRTHVINAALAYDLGSNWRLGGRVSAYRGVPANVAYPQAAETPPRGPAYYRLDWRLEKRWLLGTNGAWWALVMEVLNTTLNEETLNTSCYAYGCKGEPFGPVTIPSIGLEASF